MKELARAQFQLFIACKPERWREREGMRRVCAYRWMHTWAGFSMQCVFVRLYACACTSHDPNSLPGVFLHILSHSCGSSVNSPALLASFSLFSSFCLCYLSSLGIDSFFQPFFLFLFPPFCYSALFPKHFPQLPPEFLRVPVITICFG